MSSPLLAQGPLDVGALVDAVRHPAHGASTVFIGSTRVEGTGPAAVVALAYEAYDAMALDVIADVITDAEARFGALVRVAHRLGEVAAGEASIAVAASAPHRAAAFAACRFAVDALKHDLPMWKQEIRADGTRAWRDGLAPAIPCTP